MDAKRSLRILLVEDNQKEAQLLADYIATQGDVELVAQTGSASEGLQLVLDKRPDAIVLDLELSEGNGIQFLSKLNALNLPTRPYVMVTTWISDPATLQCMRDRHSFVQQKSQPGYGPALVISLLRELTPYSKFCGAGEAAQEPVHLPESEKHLRAQIVETLGRVDLAGGGLSDMYLAESIFVAARSKELADGIVDMDNVIYPALVAKFGVTRGSIEKAMRGKIESSWSHVDIDTLKKEYTAYVSPTKGKPELKKLIAYYANKFR